MGKIKTDEHDKKMLEYLQFQKEKTKRAQVEIHTTPLRTTSVSVSLFWYTTPGQSIKKILLVMVMYCHTLVSPGIGATLQTYRYIKIHQKFFLKIVI